MFVEARMLSLPEMPCVASITSWSSKNCLPHYLTSACIYLYKNLYHILIQQYYLDKLIQILLSSRQLI